MEVRLLATSPIQPGVSKLDLGVHPFTEVEMDILVIDDDPLTLRLVAFLMKEEGYRVATTDNASSAMAILQQRDIDLIILDVMMPQLDGFELAEQLRRSGYDMAVIFLTAKGEPEDRIRGLRLGDDYIVKPFNYGELVARVQTVSRRYQRLNPTSGEGLVGAAGLELDASQLTVVLPNKRRVSLTPIEMKVLYCLIANAGRVVSMERLAQSVWGTNNGGTSPIRVYISRIRRKLEDYSDRPKYIERVRGAGYRFKTEG